MSLGAFAYDQGACRLMSALCMVCCQVWITQAPFTSEGWNPSLSCRWFRWEALGLRLRCFAVRFDLWFRPAVAGRDASFPPACGLYFMMLLLVVSSSSIG